MREDLRVDVIWRVAGEKVEDVDTAAEGCDQRLFVEFNEVIDVVIDIVEIRWYW